MADLMSKPGANSAVELSNKIQGMQRAYAPPDNLDEDIAGAPQFAARYFQRTKDEEDIDLKQRFVRKVAGKMQGKQDGQDGTVLVSYSPDSQELDIVKRKQAQGVQYAFNNFVKSLVRPDQSFVNAKYFADHFPSILQKELEEVDTKFEQLKRLAKIMIRNQINEEDAAYLFSIASMSADDQFRYIQWLKHPVFLPWDKTDEDEIHRKGVLNPKRMFGEVFGVKDKNKGTLAAWSGDAGDGTQIPSIFKQGNRGPSLFANGTTTYKPENTGEMLKNFFK